MNKILRKKLLRDLMTQKWLFISVTIVVFLGIALFGASFMAFLNLKTSYDYSYSQLKFADFTVTVASTSPDTVTELTSVAGVGAVTGRLNTSMGMNLPQKNDQSLVATVISLPEANRPAVNDVKIESGSYFSGTDNHEILLETSFANYHKLQPGDTVSLATTDGQKIDFTVAGTVTSPEYIFPAKSKNEFFTSPDTWGVVFIPDTVIPELTGSNSINQFCFLDTAGADRQSVIEAVSTKLAPVGVQEVVTQDEQPSNAGLKLDLSEFGEIAEIFPLLFLFVGGMTTFILISRIIQRQRNQLGLIRALGYSRMQVLIHYLSFALIIGVIGSVLGMIAGYFLSEAVTDLYIGMLGLPYKVVEFHWLALEEGTSAGIIPCLIAGIFPALSASKLKPADAMRTPPPTTGRKQLYEKLFPFLDKLSLLWKIPMRNIFRNRRRSISTILGVTFGTMLILVSAGFLDSIDNLFSVQFDQVQKYDAKVSFAQPVPQSTATNMLSWNGVTGTEPVLELPASLDSNGNTYSTLVMGMTADSPLWGLNSAKVDTSEKLASGHILLAEGIKNKLKASVGDFVTVTTPYGNKTFTLDGFVKQPMGSFGFVLLDDAQQMTGGQSIITSVLVGLDSSAVSGFRNTVSQQMTGVSVEISQETRDQMQSLMSLINTLMWVMLGFGAVLALMVVYTMISVSLVERRRETATMRTLGITRGRIGSMITIENMLLGIVGLIFGIPLGYLVTMYMMKLLQTDMFSFDLVFYARTFVLTGCLAIIVVLISELPGILGLNKIDLARVTKEQIS